MKFTTQAAGLIRPDNLCSLTFVRSISCGLINMRAFIAIDLPKEIKNYLNLLEEKLKQSGADVKWVTPINIHLTLKFLGDVDTNKINQITHILDEISLNQAQFPLELGSAGAFPNIKSPRVIWVGINKGDNEVKKIVADLEKEIEKIGIAKEDKPFSSHITIGRVKSNLNREKLTQSLANLTAKADIRNPFIINKITLFKSSLTPKGPIYEAVKETSLKTD